MKKLIIIGLAIIFTNQTVGCLSSDEDNKIQSPSEDNIDFMLDIGDQTFSKNTRLVVKTLISNNLNHTIKFDSYPKVHVCMNFSNGEEYQSFSIIHCDIGLILSPGETVNANTKHMGDECVFFYSNYLDDRTPCDLIISGYLEYDLIIESNQIFIHID